MIDDAVTRIQAIEQKLTEKTPAQLQLRLTIRGCLKELRTLSHVNDAPSIAPTSIAVRSIAPKAITP